MKRTLPLAAPDITDRERELVMQVLQSSDLSMGPMVRKFESMVAEYIGTKHAVSVSNGTCGLHLCMKAAGVSQGDRVITTPFSFVASANCIRYEGAIPEFVDIDPDTFNLDPMKVEEKMRGLRDMGIDAKAVLPVHVFGQPCDMDSISKLADEYDIALIEDACEAIGAEHNGKKAGSFGLASVFSFYPNKQVTLGEGGVIVTDDDEFAEMCRSLSNQGRDMDKVWLNHVRLGYNYRLDEMSAALGVGQFERIEELIEKRRIVASWYSGRLRENEEVRTQTIVPQTTKMSWFVYVVRIDSTVNRDGVMADLEKRGIPSRPYFNPIHLQPFYRSELGYGVGDFPITEAVASSTLALPFHGNMKQEEVEYVCENLEDVINRQRQR